MLYRTCTIISSIDLAHYGVFRAKNKVYVDCGTSVFISLFCSIYSCSRNISLISSGLINNKRAKIALNRSPEFKSSNPKQVQHSFWYPEAII